MFFNELSIELSSYSDYENLRDVYKCALKKRITVCHISQSHHRKLQELVSQNFNESQRKMIEGILYSFLVTPYEGSDDKILTEYITHRWCYQAIECEGFAWAYLYDTLALSLSQPQWQNLDIAITKDDTIQCDVKNISSKTDFDCLNTWFEERTDITLIECELEPENKIINLGEVPHHGREELRRISNRLVKNKYVVKIVRSRGYQANAKSFVTDISNDGEITIALIWYEKGYSLVLQSTGRTRNETEKIAELLTKEFGSP